MMIFLTLLLSSGLIFITATATIRNESLCYQASKYVIPMHYDIKLTTYIEGNHFYGEYNINIYINNKTKHIYLYSERLCIKNINLITNFESYHGNDKDTVYIPTYKTEKDTIHISFTDELSPGNYILNIKYYGTADEVFRIHNVKGKTTFIGGLHFQLLDALPFVSNSCLHLHDLWLEATFNISIGCNQCTAMTNMPLRNIEVDENNLNWKHYYTAPLMWTDHATIIVSNYLIPIDIKTRNIEMWCGYGMYEETVKIIVFEKIMNISCLDIKIPNITIWCRNESRFHMEYAKNVIKNITLFLNNNWKHSNNILKVDHVALPNLHDKGTIVFGFVIYRETDIIYDKNIYPISHKIEVAHLVGRKMTQQWFSNMMNSRLLSNFWFHEGFITLLATYAVNKIYPNYQIINLFVVQNQHYFFNLDCDYYMWPSTSQNNRSLEIPNSIRAPFIIRMMQHVVSEEVFWKSFRTYVYSTRNLMKLWEEIIAAAENPNISEQIINNWHMETHCPIINVKLTSYMNVMKVNVSIQYIDTLKIDCLPVTFTMQTSPNFKNFSQHMVCVSKDLSLSFQEYGWIIFNIQQIGYYRVNYDDENWQSISYYLHTNDHTRIHVLNRAQIINDAFYFMIAGQLKFSTFMDIISYLRKENNYIAWYPLFKALEYTFSTFSVSMLDTSLYIFENTIKHMLNELLKRIKYEEINDTDELKICLRQEAVRWACFLRNFDCEKEAHNKLKQHLQNRKEHKLLPWWKEWTYCKGLMTAEVKTWLSVYEIANKKNDTKYFEFLACTKDTNIIKDNIRPLTYLQQENIFNSFLHIITKHARDPNILQYILDNFLIIIPKHVKIPAALIIIINNVYTENHTKQIEEYVRLKVKGHFPSGILITANVMNMYHKEKDFITKNSDKIKRKLSIRNNQINRQILFFEKFRA